VRWRSAGWQIRAGAILLTGAVRGMAQYRADLLLTMLAGALYQTTGFLTIWVVLVRFHDIAGWSVTDVALLYGIRLCAHGIWVLPFNQLMTVEDQVREGTFDRFLVRPVNPLVQLMTTRVRLSTVGDLLAGFTLLGVAMPLSGVDWSVGSVAFVVAAVVGGAALEGGYQLGLSAMAFRTLGARQIRFTADTVFSLYGNYPARVFSRVGRWALTVVVPVVFVAYLPASVLLGRTAEVGLPPAVAYASPMAGVVVFVAAYAWWRTQLRHYQSAGN
jgi:ABC-2 type transport system permease protein